MIGKNYVCGTNPNECPFLSPFLWNTSPADHEDIDIHSFGLGNNDKKTRRDIFTKAPDSSVDR